jgi:peptidoglycan hydrolase-like protein with peptidoglycan-binding domain
MKVIIDAGHGGSDPGGEGNGYIEKELTLPVARRLAELLKKYNPDVTRDQDLTLDPEVRAEIIKDKYDYCLSVHFNAANGNGSGIETIYSAFSERGKILAQYIADSLKDVTGLHIRRVFCKKNSKGQDNYYLHRWTGKTTTILIEPLFIDRKDDIQYMNIERIAVGIAQGFEAYIQSITPKVPEPIDCPVLRRGDKGEPVKELQRLLGGLVVDGSFGPLTEAAVIAYQQTNGLKVDGVVGPETWGHLRSRSQGTTNYEYYKVSETHVVEVDPMSLQLAVCDQPGNKIPLKNCVTSGYQWYHPNGETYPLGILVSEGRIINSWQPHDRPAGTLIVYRNGTVTVKELLTIDKEPEVWFAVSGCTILPEIRMQSAGFVGVYSDIARADWRPVMGYNPSKRKIIIAVRPSSSIERGKQTLQNLGCDSGITLDAGGSTFLKANGILHKSTTRRLYSVVTW